MPSYRIAHAAPYEGDLHGRIQGWNVRYTDDHLIADVHDPALARAMLRENPRLLRDRYWAKVRNFAQWEGDGLQCNILGHVIRKRKVTGSDGKQDIIPVPGYFTPSVFMKNGSRELVVYFMGKTDGLPALRARITDRLHPGRKRGYLHPLTFLPEELKALADIDKIPDFDFRELGAPEPGSGNRVFVKGDYVSESPHVRNYPRNERTLLNYPSKGLTPRGAAEPTYVRISENGSIYSFSALPSDLHRWVQETLLPIVRKNRGDRLSLPGEHDENEDDE